MRVYNMSHSLIKGDRFTCKRGVSRFKVAAHYTSNSRIMASWVSRAYHSSIKLDSEAIYAKSSQFPLQVYTPRVFGRRMQLGLRKARKADRKKGKQGKGKKKLARGRSRAGLKRLRAMKGSTSSLRVDEDEEKAGDGEEEHDAEDEAKSSVAKTSSKPRAKAKAKAKAKATAKAKAKAKATAKPDRQRDWQARSMGQARSERGRGCAGQESLQASR